MTTQDRATRVRMLLFDVDGVLTDGTLLIDGEGREWQRFDIRDGLALASVQKAGLVIGLVSSRVSAAVTHRAAQLGVRHVRQGVSDKLGEVLRLAAAEGVGLDAVSYMGDDLVDLPVLTQVGLGAAPADAAAEVRAAAHLVTTAHGGRGAVRELVEFILRTQGRWDGIVAAYTQSRG